MSDCPENFALMVKKLETTIRGMDTEIEYLPTDTLSSSIITNIDFNFYFPLFFEI